MDQKNLALEAIRKKLLGKKLSYKEIYAIMDQIAEDRLGDVLTTYFVASGFSKGFSNEELFFLTKAMVETGEKLNFRGIVADKHSIGGSPGGRTTLVVVPIVAAAGFKIPKSSSRAITTPAGTADSMEVFSKVDFLKKDVYRIVEKTNACIVWGGSFNIAPADDEIIRVEEPLLFESFDKIIVSVLAKKIAFGSNHVVIEVPYGKAMKVQKIDDTQVLKSKFEFLAKKFDIEIKVLVNRIDEPSGAGVGPLLEAKDALEVLEQTPTRPLILEERALDLAEAVIRLCLSDRDIKKKEIESKYGSLRMWIEEILKSGQALSKFREIIEAQDGDPDITSQKLKPGKFEIEIKSSQSGMIKSIDSKNITIIARILGAPTDKRAGIFLRTRVGEKVQKGSILASFYSQSRFNLKEARDSENLFPIYSIV